MWFSKPKTKTYTVISPKQAGYTTDLTMTLPFGFDAPIEQINLWMHRAALMEKCGDLEIKDQKSIIDKQAIEIQSLQEAVKRYATEATELRDELDAKTKKYERSYAGLGDLYICSTDQNADLRAKLEEAEDAFCGLYEDYEELVQLLQEVLEDPEEEEPKKQKKGKANGNKDQKGKPR